MAARRPKYSAEDIARILRQPSVAQGRQGNLPGVTEGVITCPHCGEPVPIRIVISRVDVAIQFPRKKLMPAA